MGSNNKIHFPNINTYPVILEADTFKVVVLLVVVSSSQLTLKVEKSQKAF
jgi:hypothetical protein